LLELFGASASTAAGVTVTAESALRVPAIAAAKRSHRRILKLPRHPVHRDPVHRQVEFQIPRGLKAATPRVALPLELAGDQKALAHA
jgi:hypothetical protein